MALNSLVPLLVTDVPDEELRLRFAMKALELRQDRVEYAAEWLFGQMSSGMPFLKDMVQAQGKRVDPRQVPAIIPC